ncbi:MAG: glycosyltransferase [bacterium]
MKVRPNDKELHRKFLECKRKHILMITNHGIHQWKVIPGLRDTGGQNVFVNYMTDALSEAGMKVTIVNRGGYEHSVTGEMRRGIRYKNSTERILYIEDGKKEFIRKEDMNDRIPELVDFLTDFLKEEGAEPVLMVTHYWDAAKIGVSVKDRLGGDYPHVWVPHSLGALKKKKVDSSRYKDLRIDERIEAEKMVLESVSRVGYTSEDIKESLEEDYGYRSDLFLPPCIDLNRFHPRDLPEGEPIWDFLAERSPLSEEEIRKRKIVVEISRTDTTKRKDVLITAFARAKKEVDDSLLIIAIDDRRKEIADDLYSIIEKEGVKDSVITVGSVYDELPFIFAASNVYCTPSINEGFGMSVQEAAASGLPSVSSDLVPFTMEYMLGDNPQELFSDRSKDSPLKGEATIIAKADETDCFAEALVYILTNNVERRKMGDKAFERTIPYFTWQRMVRDFLREMGITASRNE